MTVGSTKKGDGLCDRKGWLGGRRGERGGGRRREGGGDRERGGGSAALSFSGLLDGRMERGEGCRDTSVGKLLDAEGATLVGDGSSISELWLRASSLPWRLLTSIQLFMRYLG